MSAKSAIEELLKDPWQNVKELAKKHNVSYSWVRNKMSEENIKVSELREEWIKQAREYLKETEFEFESNEEI